MYVFLGLILLLMPIFVIVAVWTNLIKLIRIKILLTLIAFIMLICLSALGNRQNELDESENALNYCMSIDREYLSCLDESDTDDQFMDCVYNNRKELIDIYK